MTISYKKFFSYREDIDGLRGFAVLAVIINHFNSQILQGGFLGVDIFFVISGFVITASIDKRNTKNSSLKNFLATFYKRRLQRLLPILLIFILITSIAVYAFMPYPVLTIRAGMSSIFGLSNLYFIKRSLDYFDTSALLNPFTHTWSLAVEEQFYILYPFITWFTGFCQKKNKANDYLFRLLILLSTLSLLLYIYLYPSNQPLAYFLLPTRFWEIATGCLIFIFLKKKFKNKIIISNLNINYLVLSIIFLMLLPNKFTVFTTIFVVFLTSLIIIGNPNSSKKKSILLNKYLVYVGKISYSLYLWHWPIIWLTRVTFGINILTSIFSIVFLFITALVSFHLIENRIRRAQINSFFLKAFLGSLFLFSGLLFSSRTIARNIYNLINFDYPLKEEQVEVNLIKANVNEKNILKEKTVYIFGDSHASVYEPGIQKNLKFTKLKNITTAQGCAYMPKEQAMLINRINIFTLKVFRCSEYLEKVDRIVQNEIKSGDAIFLGIDWTKNGGKKDLKNLDLTFYELAKKVTEKDAFFILMGDVPDVGEPFVCKKAWYRVPQLKCKIPISRINDLQVSLDNIGQNLLKNIPNSRYIILRDSLCQKDQTCGAYIEEDYLWKDQGHLTPQASYKYTSKKFKEILDDIYGDGKY